MHNKVIYASNKVNWDAYQLERNQRGINYCVRKIKNLDKYMASLRNGISILDMIFQTPAYMAYIEKVAEIKRQQDQLWQECAKKRAAIERQQQDIRQHKQELKQAKKSAKALKAGSSSDDGHRF